MVILESLRAFVIGAIDCCFNLGTDLLGNDKAEMFMSYLNKTMHIVCESYVKEKGNEIHGNIESKNLVVTRDYEVKVINNAFIE